MYFETLGSIPIFDVSLLANLPISSICSFNYVFTIALSPSTTIFPLPGEFISRYIIVAYEVDNTVIKYIAKSHLYCLTQSSVSSNNVDIPDTDSTDSKNLLNKLIV